MPASSGGGARSDGAACWRCRQGNPLLVLVCGCFCAWRVAELDLTRLYAGTRFSLCEERRPMAHDYLEQLRQIPDRRVWPRLDARIRVGVELRTIRSALRRRDLAGHGGILRATIPCSALTLYERLVCPNEKRNARLGAWRRPDRRLDEWEQVRADVFRCNRCSDRCGVHKIEDSEQRQMMRRAGTSLAWKDPRDARAGDYLHLCRHCARSGEYGLAARNRTIGTGTSRPARMAIRSGARTACIPSQTGRLTELKNAVQSDRRRSAGLDGHRQAACGSAAWRRGSYESKSLGHALRRMNRAAGRHPASPARRNTGETQRFGGVFGGGDEAEAVRCARREQSPGGTQQQRLDPSESGFDRPACAADWDTPPSAA